LSKTSNHIVNLLFPRINILIALYVAWRYILCCFAKLDLYKVEQITRSHTLHRAFNRHACITTRDWFYSTPIDLPTCHLFYSTPRSTYMSPVFRWRKIDQCASPIGLKCFHSPTKYFNQANLVIIIHVQPDTSTRSSAIMALLNAPYNTMS